MKVDFNSTAPFVDSLSLLSVGSTSMEEDLNPTIEEDPNRTIITVTNVEYTIGDAMRYTESIMDLRRILAEHNKDREDILDRIELENLQSSRQHPVLAKQRSGEHPSSSWLHVKLQVVEEGKEPSWTTLIMRDDNVYVCGFMDRNGKLYRLIDNNTKSVATIPTGDHNNGIEDLKWTVSYTSLLGATEDEVRGLLPDRKLETHRNEVVRKLVEARLGRRFAVDAVRRLSSPEHHPDAVVDGMISGKLALGGLIVLVCESARMNPLHDSFARGWSTGGGFKEKLMRDYVWDYYGRTSEKLREWKRKNYRWKEYGPIPHLQAMHLVLNAALPNEKGKKMLKNKEGRKLRTKGGEKGNDAGRAPRKSKEARHAAGNPAMHPREAVDADSGGGSASQTEEDGDGGPSRGNSDSQPWEVDSDYTSGEDGDHTSGEDTGEADDTLGHGRPLVELLAVHANLSVVDTKIIVFDGKRGQIIYKHAKGISAYGSFTIKVDIPDADPARFEWDCYDTRNADEVDAEEPSDGEIRDPNDNRKVLANVTYAVMSNALEATVHNVMLRLKDDGHTLNDVHGEIKARIDGFKVGSILFKPTQGAGQCFSPAGDSWFLLQLARNVVAVPCGKVLHIEVDLKTEASNDQGPMPLEVNLKFDNGTLSQSSLDDNGNEVKVDIAWYPEISRPSHPLEQTIGEVGAQEFITALPEPSDPEVNIIEDIGER
ncbi:hypothetical protein SETIT_8G041900v2 [Setaria italica]|uniref:DUF6598 domain-containing protein n=1 Tax=Setaria italica TaxID=4555 RepID=A0A368S417_SETIT|nr:hypothetical protein SETIT_8G041900v2 [Setaria italica]